MAQSFRSVHATFWTGKTGKQIRKAGAQAQVMALYAVTSPHANMIGLYYLPIDYIVKDTGLLEPEVRAALATLEGLGFVRYDDEAEWIWVCEAVIFQVGTTNKNRIDGARALFNEIADTSLKVHFWKRYRSLLSLPACGMDAASESQGSDTIATPKPQGSGSRVAGGIETETEIERETGLGGAAAPAPPPEVPPAQPIKRLLWEHHRRFYARYGDNPAPYTGQHASLAGRALKGHSLERLAELLDLWFADGDPFFAQSGHAFAAFVKCLDKLVALAGRPRARASPEAWQALLARLETRLPRREVLDWFTPLRCLRDDGDRLVVQGTEERVTWIERHHRAALADSLDEVRPGLTIGWQVTSEVVS